MTLTCSVRHALLGVCAAAVASPLPYWTAPRGDPSYPLGGFPLIAGVSYSLVYNATPTIGTYNHAAMITYGGSEGDAPLFLVAFKNGVVDEDAPGQRVLYSQSSDGRVWTPVGPPAPPSAWVLFPNMSTASFPVHLFAGPPIFISGRLYASASPTQFCLFPDQYAPVLLLRRVYTNTTGLLGPAFWAAGTIPPGYEEASAINGVVTVGETDAVTQADVATLTPTSPTVPCDVPGGASTKCEACAQGCQPWSDVTGMGNERTHYTLGGGPDSSHDVLLYRTSSGTLKASVRDTPTQAGWTLPVDTNIPNDNSNINAGPLPDGRRFLLANAMPAAIRDPLTVATSADGLNWSTCSAVMSCTLLPGDGCGPRFPGRYKNPGPSYPQGVVVPSLSALFVVATNNKENVWVAAVPLANL